MDENPIIKALREYLPALSMFLGSVALALSPIWGKGIMERLTGKQKADSDTSAAGVAQSLIVATKDLSDLTQKILDETNQLNARKLAEKDIVIAEKDEEIKAIKHEMKKAVGIVETQNTKLKRQLEWVRREAAQYRRADEIHMAQLRRHELPPETVPLMMGDE